VKPSVHRLHDGGIWSSRTEVERARTQHALFAGFSEEFALSGHDDLARYYRRMARALGTYARVADLHPSVAAAMAVARRSAWGS
jgi:2-keto-3-deoxy-galactonokinase